MHVINLIVDGIKMSINTDNLFIAEIQAIILILKLKANITVI